MDQQAAETETEKVPNISLAELYQTIRPRYSELSGQVAIVTGSSRGIGKGIALRLAREGMKLVITGLDQKEVEITASQLRELGATTLAVPGDLSRTEEVDFLFQKTVETFGSLALLVNNAASLRRARFFDVDEALLDLQLNSNVKGPFQCAYRAAQLMRDSGEGGNIIQISSVGGLRAHWWGLPYDVTKGALDAMTRAMALELCEYNIRVNAVAPGAIRSEPFPPNIETAKIQERVKRVPVGRFGTPLDIGAAVAFLASAEASYIIGQVIYVDGGLVTQLSPRGQDI
jgi:NAD(P)-dependent dehydrogenase (short-subunit alcohol dehydrogenase family)